MESIEYVFHCSENDSAEFGSWKGRYTRGVMGWKGTNIYIIPCNDLNNYRYCRSQVPSENDFFEEYSEEINNSPLHTVLSKMFSFNCENLSDVIFELVNCGIQDNYFMKGRLVTPTITRVECRGGIYFIKTNTDTGVSFVVNSLWRLIHELQSVFLVMEDKGVDWVRY